MEEGILPRDWKDANVTPIHRKGNKNDRVNYQPGSLTSIVCKMMERIVWDQVIKNLKQFLVSCQHGLMEGCSCVTQLMDTIDS